MILTRSKNRLWRRQVAQTGAAHRASLETEAEVKMRLEAMLEVDFKVEQAAVESTALLGGCLRLKGLRAMIDLLSPCLASRAAGAGSMAATTAVSQPFKFACPWELSPKESARFNFHQAIRAFVAS
jgi:hypothetical protein